MGLPLIAQPNEPKGNKPGDDAGAGEWLWVGGVRPGGH